VFGKQIYESGTSHKVPEWVSRIDHEDRNALRAGRTAIKTPDAVMPAGQRRREMLVSKRKGRGVWTSPTNSGFQNLTSFEIFTFRFSASSCLAKGIRARRSPSESCMSNCVQNR
jgi:hypothetical protein